MVNKNKSRKEVNINLTKDQDNKLLAFLASFFTIIGFLIAFIIRKNNEYVMFYAKQGLVLFIFAIVSSIISIIPIIGKILSNILLIIFLILWIITWLNALSGKKINTLIIGELAEKIKI